MSILDELLKGILRSPEPMELEFTRMLLDIRGYTTEEIELFFKKVGKRPIAIGELIEVRHSREFTLVPGLFSNKDPYKRAVDTGAHKYHKRLGWIYDLPLVMLRTGMEWEVIETPLYNVGASFGYLMGISVHHEKTTDGQQATVSLTIQPFRLDDSD